MAIIATGGITLTDLNDVTVSISAPSKPYTGQLWWKSDESQLYVYQGGIWLKSNNTIVGGRNLLYNTSFKKDLNGSQWYRRGTDFTMSIDTENQYNGVNTLKIVRTASSSGSQDVVGNSTTDAFSSTEYTLTFFAKSSVDGVVLESRWGYVDDTQKSTLTTDWIRYSVTVKTGTSIWSGIIFKFNTLATVWIAMPKLELGNIPTDYTEAPEDTQGQIDDLDESVQTISSALSGKVDDTTYQSFVQQTANSLASKISATDVANNYVKTSTFTQTVNGIQTSVNDKVSSSQFTQLATAVDLKMSTQDANAKFATQSQLTATSGSLTSSITAVQNDLSNLEIGGRNIIRNGDFSDGLTNWTAWGGGAKSVVDITDLVGFSKAFKLVSDGQNQGVIQNYVVKPNSKYTISFWAKVDSGNGYVQLSVNKVSGMEYKNAGVANTTEWVKRVYVWNTPSDINNVTIQVGRGGGASNGIYYFTGFKFEEGTKDTSYTPAPEDTVNTATYNSYVQQTAQALNSKLSITDASNTYATQSQLTQTANSITSQITSAVNWKEVTTTADVNTYTTQGKYFLKGTLSNAPITAWAYLIVEKFDGSRIKQTIQKDNSILVYERIYSGSWSAWVKTANASDISGLDSKISTINQTIDGIQSTVSNKADTSTVTQLAGVVDSKISTTDANAKFATQSQLTQTSTSLTSTISQVQTNLDNLEVGGRNLVVGTKDFSGRFTIKSKSTETYMDCAVATGTGTTSGYVDTVAGWTPVLDGLEYTVSFYAKSNNETQNIVCHFYQPNTTTATVSSTGQKASNGDGNITVTVTNEWKRYWVTWKQSASGSEKRFIIGRITGATSNVSIAGVKFEKGNKATDYSPASEDIDNQFSTINQTIDGIATKVSTAEGNISTLTQTAQGLQSAVSGKVDNSTYQSFVTQTNSALNSKISTTDANNKFATQSQLTQTSSSLTSTISSLSNEVDKKISRTGFRTGGTGADNAGKWVRFARTRVTSRYGYAIASFDINGGGSGQSRGRYGTVTIYHKQQNELGSSTIIDIALREAYWLVPEDFRGIVTTNNSSNVIVDYYVKVRAQHEEYFLQPYNEYVTGSTPIEYFSSQGFIVEANLPSGQTSIGTANGTTLGKVVEAESQISQLSDAINLRVTKNDVINQINISTEGILIAGQKIRITGDTTIDNAVIKNAMIADLSASKLTAGTINASVITVSNINASNITTGTLSASRIASNSITTDKIATNAVTANEIATGSITATNGIVASLDAGKITVGTLNADRIATNAITSDKIAIGDFTNYTSWLEKGNANTSPWSSKALVDKTVYRTEIASLKLPPNNTGIGLLTKISAMSGEKIYYEFWIKTDSNWNGTAGNSKFRFGDQNGSFLTAIGYNGVKTSWTKYSGVYTVPNDVTAIQLSIGNDGSTGNVWIDDIILSKQVKGQLIVDGTITADHIASRTISADKLVSGTITASSGVIANLAIGTAQIQDSAITNAKIANLAVDEANIANGAITNAKIANLDASKITTGTLNASRIGANTITATHISSLNGLNVANGNFVIDSSGNVTIKGKLDGATGTFAGNITSKSLTIGPDVPGTWSSSDRIQLVLKNYKTATEWGTPFVLSGTNDTFYIDGPAGGTLQLGPLMNVTASTFESTWGNIDYVTAVTMDVNSLNVISGNTTHMTFNAIGATFYKDVILGTDSTLDAKNSNIINVNSLKFNDPGANEGIEWTGGNGWKIYEAPNALTNSSGNLQFVTNTTRNMTLGPDGVLYVRAGYYTDGDLKVGNVRLNGANSIENTSQTIYISGNGGVVLNNTANSKSDWRVGSDSTGARLYSTGGFDRNYTGTANAQITAEGTIGRTSSARRFKIDEKVVPLEKAYKILDIEPKNWFDRTSVETYAKLLERESNGEVVNWSEEDIPYIERIPGLVAEDVESVGLSDYVIYESPNELGVRRTQSLMYDRLWTLLIPVVRDHNESINDVKTDVEILAERMYQLERENAMLKQRLSDNGL